MDLIEKLASVAEDYSAARFKPLTGAEQQKLALLPDDLMSRLHAAAMRHAWREYIEPALLEIQRTEEATTNALRYPE